MVETDSMGMVEESIVLLPVPRQHYPAVVRALAAAMDATSELQPSIQVSGDEESGAGDESAKPSWTQDEIRRLKDILRNPSVLALLDLTSERPREWVSIREVEQRADRTFPQMRADLGGFTKAVKRQFDAHVDKWPFEAAWAVDGEQRYSYRVSEDVARWWREA